MCWKEADAFGKAMRCKHAADTAAHLACPAPQSTHLKLIAELYDKCQEVCTQVRCNSCRQTLPEPRYAAATAAATSTAVILLLLVYVSQSGVAACRCSSTAAACLALVACSWCWQCTQRMLLTLPSPPMLLPAVRRVPAARAARG